MAMKLIESSEQQQMCPWLVAASTLDDSAVNMRALRV